MRGTAATPAANYLFKFNEKDPKLLEEGRKDNYVHLVMQLLYQELTPEQRSEALGYLMFLKRKRCGKVKGRGCADGRKQRAYISKEEAASPTVSTEAVFLTAVIDALKG